MTQDSPPPSASAESGWEDRRATPRHKTNLEVRWHLRSEKPIQKKSGRLVDLSISGAALRTDASLAIGDPISLTLPPKKKASSTLADGSSAASGSGPALSVPGTIVNSSQTDDGEWRYGIQFERLYYTLASWTDN